MAVDFTPTMKEYTNQGKFRYWVQMVLPTIYDDSLSYMELLNKVVYVINLAIEDVDAVEDNVTALLEAFQELQQYTNDYFDNLDVQEEINNKLDEMVSSGVLSQILDPLIAISTANWLAEHITPTSPAIDNTLTISGAGADAKVTGDKLKKRMAFVRTLSGTNNDVDTLTDFGIYRWGSSSIPTNLPEARIGNLIYWTPEASTSAQTVIYNNGKMYNRFKTTTGWGNWVEIIIRTDMISYVQNELNNYFKFVATLTGVNNADDLRIFGAYRWTSANTPQNMPKSGAGQLLFFGETNTTTTATQVAIYNDGSLYLRWKFQANWGEWILVNGGGDTYNNYYTTNEYNDTYNVTATPQITTDNLYILESTNDTTDRTADIQALLNTNKICRLGAGVFYVTGIDMPDDSELVGQGYATNIILNDSVVDGYAVKVKRHCILKNVRISGASSTITPSETVGTRHGVIFEGNADGSGNIIPRFAIISECFIIGFAGGGITARNTGTATSSSFIMSNSIIYNCDAGINISYYSEYNRFIGVQCRSCYYGVINNGGNNIFTGCNISTNTVGVLMDNSNNQSPNNTHGSMVGCSINHSGGNTGDAIKILGGQNGFTFTGCQLWHGNIVLINSVGIIFGDTIFGGVTINTNNCGSVIFDNCQFKTQPTKQINNTTRFIMSECYLMDGTIVTN